MKVRIVCYEDVNTWILGKFALKMQENLLALGIEVDISKIPDENADINHHIIYGGYGNKVSGIDTLMITHIDELEKIDLLKNQLTTAKMGICMSKETMISLSGIGIPRSKLCYINPAHDGVIKPRPYVIGITCRVQKDGRKREYLIRELAKKLNPLDFSFKIMGEHWDDIVNLLKLKGFEVEYYSTFNYDTYTKLIPSLDFYLYMGLDEGQMGFIDALAAGVETIVTPQGYHLDAEGGITYPFKTFEQLLSVFNYIAEHRKKLCNSVMYWNWQDYTKKHLDIWNYLIMKKIGRPYIIGQNNYKDGLYSIEDFRNDVETFSIKSKFKLYYFLTKESIRHRIYFYKNRKRAY